MPLTPAHAAAAWPITRVAPALPVATFVIGTLSPDFEYFLRLAPRTEFSHTLRGLALFCLPVSLLAWALYALLLRPALLDLLVPGIKARPARRPVGRNVRPLAWGVAAALAGAATHLAWDSFTHQGGSAVRLIPALATDVAPALIPGLRWYKVLQHGSTVVGILLVAVWIARTWRRRPPEWRESAPGHARRALRAGMALLALAALAGAGNALRAPAGGVAQPLGFAAVGAMLGLVLATAVYGAVVQLRCRT
jgi:hypothetical protein